MQTSVPELTDVTKEPESTYKMYGDDARKGGTFAHSCLMARRLVERGVRFVQVYHRGWDVHNTLPDVLTSQCKDVDQGCWALVQDLKARGLLDDTVVVWSGEFGRTIYSQGKLTQTDYGRDHHPRCFTLWMAGGGVKGGIVHGETDEFSYNIVKDPVHVRDFQATLLHLFGIDHERFTYKYQGLDQRLTGVEPASSGEGNYQLTPQCAAVIRIDSVPDLPSFRRRRIQTVLSGTAVGTARVVWIPARAALGRNDGLCRIGALRFPWF